MQYESGETAWEKTTHAFDACIDTERMSVCKLDVTLAFIPENRLLPLHRVVTLMQIPSVAVHRH